MRVTVCELPHQPDLLEPAWAALCAHTRAQRSELVVLPEFAFVEPVWLHEPFDDTRWRMLVVQSDTWLERLQELGAAVAVGARPILVDRQPYNEAFRWSRDGSLKSIRRKGYLTEEPDGWEGRWLKRCIAEFPVFREGELEFGVNFCTELWSLDTDSGYTRHGVHVIVSPRATAAATTVKWLALGAFAAARCGSYSLSSNQVHADGSCGGVGWIIGPDGEHLARTSPEQPFCTVNIDLTAAVAAQAIHPRHMVADPGRTP
jgi:N-carbamoylputrescine amidase